MKNRESAYTRVTLLIVDELHTYTRMGAFLSLSLCVSPLSHSQSLLLLLCLLLMMMMRETESNDDAPGGCGTRRNATIKRATRNRTSKNDKSKRVRTTAFFSFFFIHPSILSFSFSLFLLVAFFFSSSFL